MLIPAMVISNEAAPEPTTDDGAQPGNIAVAQIIGSLRIGGAEKHFVSLMNALQASKRLAIFTSANRVYPDLVDELSEDISQEFVGIRKRLAFLDIWKLVRVLRKANCDVVHTHMFWPNLFGGIAAKLAGVPVVITTEHGENRWKRPVHRWLERNVISRIADYRFCVSDAILEQRRDVDGVPQVKLGVVANGTVVPGEPAPRWGNTIPVIGSIGRFVIQKNYLLLVDVIAEMRGRGCDVRACIVGDGPEMQSIKQRISELQLDQQIELPGMVTNTEHWYRKFDIYAITSDQEGQPISLLEAMSYGLPIVSSDVGAISGTIKSGSEGLIVSRGNKEEFVEALGCYLDDRKFASDCGLNARKRVQREFSIEAIAAQYAETYFEILSRKRH